MAGNSSMQPQQQQQQQQQHHHRHLAARLPAGTEHPITLTKRGVVHTQLLPDSTTREVIACGLACSECFSGKTLYKVLQSGFQYEQYVMAQLAADGPAQPLFIQRSCGVPEPLGDFLAALELHLPWQNNNPNHELDWFVSLQIEGASAVLAAVDLLLQVERLETAVRNGGGHSASKTTKRRIKVAVGATSYHGPASTCYGAKAPIWPKEHQLVYPVPMADGSHKNEHELLIAYKAFLNQYGDEIGVIIFEPQWGSSQAALPWPEHLLKTYVNLAKQYGIKVVCDEIMCGLGRHGNGTLFLSEAWGLDPDAITFGKAIATGVFPLSGAIVKTGQKILKLNKCTVMQSHTYAGSSTRALMAATEVLKEFVTWLPHVAQLGDEMALIMRSLTKISNGLFICQGQGLMWGGTITHTGQCRDAAFRLKVVQAFKTCCDEALILPYHVPLGGFMVSPVMDIDVGTIYEIGTRLEQAVLMTMAKVGWHANDIVSSPVINSSSDRLYAAVADEPRKTSLLWCK